MNLTKSIMIAWMAFLFTAAFNAKPFKPITHQRATIVRDTALEKQLKQYQGWLKTMHLPQPSQCYETILNKMFDLASAHCLEYQALLGMDKVRLESFLNQFQMLPIHDQYVMAYLMNLHRYNSINDISNIFAIFDNKDRLIKFRYDFCQDYGNYDSIYVKDWNQDGHLDLCVESYMSKFTYRQSYIERFVTILDVTHFEHEIVDMFHYTREMYKNYDSMDISIDESSKIRFENPDLFQMTTQRTVKAAEIIGADTMRNFDNATFGALRQAQKEYMSSADTPRDTTYQTRYQRDSLSKQYERF